MNHEIRWNQKNSNAIVPQRPRECIPCRSGTCDKRGPPVDAPYRA